MGLAGAAPAGDLAPATVCATCHPAVATEWSQSGHQASASCASCHPAASTSADTGRPHAWLEPDASQDCRSCHRPPDLHSPLPFLGFGPTSGADCVHCHFPPVRRPPPRPAHRAPELDYPDVDSDPPGGADSIGRSHALAGRHHTGPAGAALERSLVEAITIRIVSIERTPDHVDVGAVLSLGPLPHPLFGTEDRPLQLVVAFRSMDDPADTASTSIALGDPAGAGPSLLPGAPVSLSARLPLSAASGPGMISTSLIRSDALSPHAVLESAVLLASDARALDDPAEFSPSWGVRAARAALQRGDPETATHWTAQLPSSHPDSPLLRATALAQQGRLDDASRILRQESGDAHWHPSTQVLLAAVATGQGNTHKAAHHWQNAAVQRPTDPFVLQGWATAARAAGDTARADAVDATLERLGYAPSSQPPASNGLDCVLEPSTCPTRTHIVLP